MVKVDRAVVDTDKLTDAELRFLVWSYEGCSTSEEFTPSLQGWFAGMAADLKTVQDGPCLAVGGCAVRPSCAA